MGGTLIPVRYGKGFEVQPSAPEIRSMILRLQDAMLADPAFDTVGKDFPVRHFKAPGMIGRQMHLPRGGLVIGKIHRHAHLNLIAYGHVRVITEDGPKEYIGTNTFTSTPGTKRVVAVLEDTLWTTFHLNPNDLDPDNEADMKQLENEIIAKSYEELDLIASHKEALQIKEQA